MNHTPAFRIRGSGLLRLPDRGGPSRHQAEFVCNECGAIVRTVPAETMQKIMELSLEFATAQCPHCAAVNLAPGFSKLTAFEQQSP
jgi:DNA-directed RNA polymerase subunit RPC12/RpoP